MSGQLPQQIPPGYNQQSQPAAQIPQQPLQNPPSHITMTKPIFPTAPDLPIVGQRPINPVGQMPVNSQTAQPQPNVIPNQMVPKPAIMPGATAPIPVPQTNVQSPIQTAQGNSSNPIPPSQQFPPGSPGATGYLKNLEPFVRFFNFQPNLDFATRNQIMIRMLPTILARIRSSQAVTNLTSSQRRGPMPTMPILPVRDNFIVNDDEVDDAIPDSESSASEIGSDDDDEDVEEEEGNEDFDQIPDDYVPDDVETSGPTTRIATRERKSTRATDTSSGESEVDEEEDAAYEDAEDISRIEHIYASRKRDEVEYLLRLYDSPPAICQWVPESLLFCLPNYEYHLNRFNQDPHDFNVFLEMTGVVVPVAHRRASPTAPREILFRFEDEGTLYFWDTVDEATYNDYIKTKSRIDIVEDPPIPTGQLPIPTDETIISNTGEKMRSYQVEGLQWLINNWQQGHGSILADEMGLGKTIQILSFFEYLVKNTPWKGPFLVIVRTNTFKQWCEEISRWTDLSYVPYCSGPAQRNIIRDYQFPALTDEGAPIPNALSFHLLLISYDVLLKDTEYLSNIPWQVLVVDEGHRIKNSQGKKNNAMANLPAKHRIILTGTPIQNTPSELWTLLHFVSPAQFGDVPEWMHEDIDAIDPEHIEELQDIIQKHLKRRTVIQVETSIAPKDEKVAFVSLTDAQRDLIRLIKLHKMWRIKPKGTPENEIDASQEGNQILKVCCHPFLIEGAEEYYTKKYSNMSRLELLLSLSTKFAWLDNVLQTLRMNNHRVLIFSQRVKLLSLLKDYCDLRGFSNTTLIGSMTDSEKSEAISMFSNNDTFIFLISTRAGNEGLNLIAADTAIIFDPDWNPQNDLQAQARVHRIGQTQQVTVFRLVTFRTYEHEMFVRAQTKLGLWMALLGNKDENKQIDDTPLKAPPRVEICTEPISDLNECIESVSTIVTDFSLASIDRIRKPLKKEPSYSNGMDDDEFIESFPIANQDYYMSLPGTRRMIRAKSNHDVSINEETAGEIFVRLQKLGYGRWEEISRGFLDDHSVHQIKRFCVCIAVLGLRMVTGVNLIYFPMLINRIATDLPSFKFLDLICTNKHKLLTVFDEDHDFYYEMQSCRKLKESLANDALKYLSVIEMKLVRDSWLSFNDKDKFSFDRLPLPQNPEADRLLYSQLISDDVFNSLDERMISIVDIMKGDLINANCLAGQVFMFPWWCSQEFFALVYVLKNFPFDKKNPKSLHARTSILTKSDEDILTFANAFIKLLVDRVKGPITIPQHLHQENLAPDDLVNSKGFSSWHQFFVKDCESTLLRIQLVEQIEKYSRTPCAVGEETEEWSDFHTHKLCDLLLKYGVDSMSEILTSERFGFARFFSETDVNYLMGTKKKRRGVNRSLAPALCFSETDFLNYLTNNNSNESRIVDESISFVLPQVTHIECFDMNDAESGPEIGDDSSGDEEFKPQYKRANDSDNFSPESSDDGM